MEFIGSPCAKNVLTPFLYKYIRLSFIILSILLLPAVPESQAIDATPAPASKIMKRDPAFMITPADLLEDINNGKKVAIVDVRQKKDFEQIRIPGSLNLPLHAIKTKNFLKDTFLIILNQGSNYRTLESECKRLTAS